MWSIKLSIHISNSDEREIVLGEFLQGKRYWIAYYYLLSNEQHCYFFLFCQRPVKYWGKEQRKHTGESSTTGKYSFHTHREACTQRIFDLSFATEALHTALMSHILPSWQEICVPLTHIHACIQKTNYEVKHIAHPRDLHTQHFLGLAKVKCSFPLTDPFTSNISGRSTGLFVPKMSDPHGSQTLRSRSPAFGW